MQWKELTGIDGVGLRKFAYVVEAGEARFVYANFVCPPSSNMQISTPNFDFASEFRSVSLFEFGLVASIEKRRILFVRASLKSKTSQKCSSSNVLNTPYSFSQKYYLRGACQSYLTIRRISFR